MISYCKDESIKYFDTMETLFPVLKDYKANSLPGRGSSDDVVHLKWSCSPAGDFNKAFGEKFPTVAFECVQKTRANSWSSSSSVWRKERQTYCPCGSHWYNDYHPMVSFSDMVTV